MLSVVNFGKLHKVLNLLRIARSFAQPFARVGLLLVNLRHRVVIVLVGLVPRRPHHVLFVVHEGTMLVFELLLSYFQFFLDLNLNILIDLVLRRPILFNLL